MSPKFPNSHGALGSNRAGYLQSDWDGGSGLMKQTTDASWNRIEAARSPQAARAAKKTDGGGVDDDEVGDSAPDSPKAAGVGAEDREGLGSLAVAEA